MMTEERLKEIEESANFMASIGMKASADIIRELVAEVRRLRAELTAAWGHEP